MSEHPAQLPALPQGVTCSTCSYWQPMASQPGLGECRHDPPRVVQTVSGTLTYPSVWPTSRGTDWCGYYTSKDVP